MTADHLTDHTIDTTAIAAEAARVCATWIEDIDRRSAEDMTKGQEHA